MATNKALGQHWLRNREILDGIAALAGEAEICLEIGPGLGTLTSALLRRFPKVIAVEYDKELARKLPGSFPGKDLTVVNEDFLQFDLAQVPTPYVVAGNIPYYITSPIIEKLLTAENRPQKIVLLMQKEVAERIGEREGGSLLSLRCHNLARIKLGPVVSRGEFEPAPKVDSQVVIFEPRAQMVDDAVINLAEKGFSQPRKKLVHNLAGVAVEGQSYSKDELKALLAENGLDPDVRPGDFELREWQKIYELMKK